MHWRRKWQPTPVFLPGESQGQGSLVGCSPWGHEELDMTERLHFPFSLSCIGEGNGNPLQCSCLENPRDGGAWWAVVYGVAQSWTRLKWLSSSSSEVFILYIENYDWLISCVNFWCGNQHRLLLKLSRGYLLRIWSVRDSATLTFPDIPRQAGEWESFTVKAGRLQVCPDWRLLVWGI